MNFVCLGCLELRSFFAVHAPKDIPDWFTPILPKEPEKPQIGDFLLNEEEKLHVNDWLRDCAYDIDEDGEQYQQVQRAYSDYWQDLNDWRRQCEIETLFQWQFYYADQMIRFSK
jgi:hypothetical protein